MGASFREKGRFTAGPPDLWDPVVRLSHWGLAVVVLANALFTRGGSALHVALGWAGIAVLALRLVWGLIGPREARFSAFPPDPRAALSHLAGLGRGHVRPYPSHNPAGALMVYALWGSLAVMLATGLWMSGAATPMTVAADEAAVAAGDWSALVKPGATEQGGGEDDQSEELVKEVHEIVSTLMLVLAALHVAGVAVESRVMKLNLVTPMVLGRRRRLPPK